MRTVSPWADSTRTSGIPLSMRRERYTALTKRRASCPLSDAKVSPAFFCTILSTVFAVNWLSSSRGGKGQPNGHVPRLLYINSHSVPPFRFEYWLRCWNFTVPAEGRRGGILRRERMGPAAFFYNDGAEIFSSLSAEQILPRIMGTALAQGLPIAGYQI